MGSGFHRLCSRYGGTLTPTAPTVTRLWETFTFFTRVILQGFPPFLFFLFAFLDAEQANSVTLDPCRNGSVYSLSFIIFVH